MNFELLTTYDNYVPAHIAMGRLQEEGINCWLKDENTLSIDPLLNNALGGIKLMVAQEQLVRARKILQQMEQEYRDTLTCPLCGSHDFVKLDKLEKEPGLLSMVTRFFMGKDAKDEETKYRCGTCFQIFDSPVSTRDQLDDDSDIPS